MPRTADQKCMYICLDRESYIMLKQKAAFKNMSMNAFLKDLAMRTVMPSHEIVIYDLTEMNHQLDILTFKASGYYNLITARDRDHPEVGLDDGDNMIRLFTGLSEYLEKSYKEFVLNRESKIQTEREKIKEILKTASRSSYRKTDFEVTVPTKSDIILTVTTEEKDIIYANINQSQGNQDNISGYFRNLIMSKQYVLLKRRYDDLHLMIERIYAATMFGGYFLSMMFHQGYECADQGRELEVLYKKVQQYEKEIWIIVENDRRSLYEEFDLKIHERPKNTLERRKSRKEKALWQSQE